MARRTSNFRFGTLLLALFIAVVLWGLANGSSTIERGVDVPVVFNGIPENLVITDQSADVVNIRVLGTNAVRALSSATMQYAVDVTGAKPGPSVYEVDTTQIELPTGATVVSRSPASLEVKFERRGRRSVKVRPDLEGDLAPGFEVLEIEVEPARVWLVGARSDVLRLSEVVTETIDLTGLDAPLERQVRLSLGGGHVWMEEAQPVNVRVAIAPLPVEPVEGLEPLEGAEEGVEAAGEATES